MTDQYLVMTDSTGFPVAVSRPLPSMEAARRCLENCLMPSNYFIVRVVYGKLINSEVN